ncbi:MAG: ABC transporter substrate-binding protein [Ilumatobacteraceae bacterium]
MHTTRREHVAVVLAVVTCLALAPACSGSASDADLRADPTAPADASVVSAPTSTAPAPRDDGSVVAAHAGERWFLGTVPAGATAADLSLAPIRLGMINQEDTPLGSYPEIRAAVEAAIAWVNAELGGVAGRPVELVPCVTRFDPDESRRCAEALADDGVVAFVGGVDVNSSESTRVIEERGLVTIGGIPATLAEQRSPNTFTFSGGDAGALAAFMSYAAARGDRRVALAYGQEVDSFEVAARDYGAVVGRSLGLDVDLVPYSIFTTDFTPLVREVVQQGDDSLMVLAATSSCVPVMTAAAASSLPLFLTGACAGDETTRAAGAAAQGVVFNAEGPVDGLDIEASIYQEVVERYADEPAGGAGTVSFRGFMNLYSLMLDLGPDAVTSAALAALARQAVGRPSFWGHPFTCDGQQVPGLPALCAPQQVLFTLADGGSGFTSVSGFIATDELFAAALR